MLKTILSTALIAGLTMSMTMSDSDKKKVGASLEIGSKAPKQTYKMAATSGKDLSLQDLKGEKGLLVVFSCNTCPFVVGGDGFGVGWESRYNDLQDYCTKNNIGMVLVNSNEAKREGDDSMDNMKAHAKKMGYKSTYVVDSNSELANAFGAKTTPHVYLFDKGMSLVYKGAIDDDNSGKDVKETYLIDALGKLSAGKKIDPNTTRNKGCSIKRIK
jgi:thioredoxin-related protein